MTSRPSAAASRSALSTPFCSVRIAASRSEMGRERLAGGFGVGRFHGEEDELRAADGVRIGARFHLKTLVEIVGLQPQSRALHRFHMLRPGDQRDFVSGAGEDGAVVAADGARAHHCNLLQRHPFRTSLPIMVPDSSFSCAFFRLAPLIGESVSFSVHAKLAGVKPLADLVQQAVLLDHVGRLEARAREHELPAHASRSSSARRPSAAASGCRRSRPARPAARPVGHRVPIGVELAAEVGDVVDVLELSDCAGGLRWSTTWSAPSSYPGDRLGPRGGSDHRAGRGLRELDADRAYAAGAADDQDAICPGWTFIRSWKASQAVIEVSGIAAACAKSSFFGLRPTMRSSTRWNSLSQPGRVTSPA